MGVKLSDFVRKVILERGLIRKNKGPSIVPLMIIRFIGFKPVEDDYFHLAPKGGVMLLTVCQRTGVISAHRDLTKLYSVGSYVDYSDWWNTSEVVNVRPPAALSTSRLLEINVDIKEMTYDQRSLAG